MTAIWTPPRTWTTGEIVTAALLNTHLRDNLEYLKLREDTALNQFSVYSNGSFSTTSTTFVDVHATLFTANITTSGAPLLIGITGSWKSTVSTADCCLDFLVNGARLGDPTYGMMIMQAPAANAFMPFAFVQVRPLGAAAYTIKPQWRTSAGTLTAAFMTNFFVIELI